MLGEYENEEALEDIEYKGHLQTQQQNAHLNASDAPASNHYNEWSRWKQIGTDCAADQRLANTSTLHCGIAVHGKMIIEPLIDNELGTCGGVKLEPNYCLMPSRGEWTTTWEGQFNDTNATMTLPPLPRRFGNQYNSSEETTQSLPRCKTQQDILDGNQQGSPDTFDREWVPNFCRLVPLNPFTWTDHSKCQVTIIMIGDSHIRNLFTATVNGLRGSPAFAEAHAGSENKDTGIILTYEWRKHGDDKNASDHFVVHNGTNNHTDHTTLFDDAMSTLHVV